MRLKHQRCASNFNHSSFLVLSWNQAKRHLRKFKDIPRYLHQLSACAQHVCSPGLSARQAPMEPLGQDNRVSRPGQPLMIQPIMNISTMRS